MADPENQFDRQDPVPAEPRDGDEGAESPRPSPSGLNSPITRRHFISGAAVAGAAVGVVSTLGAEALIGCSSSGKSTPTAVATVGPSAAGATAAAGTATPTLPQRTTGATQGAIGGVPPSTAISSAIVTLTVNGQDHTLLLQPHETLAEVLRDRLGLTGTKIGCDHSECSSCTVLLDGVPVNSCSSLAIREQGKAITTIEGLQQNGQLHPVQQAFMDNMGVQCGFCSSGQVMESLALLQSNPSPTEADIRAALSGNLCRCGAYKKILASVQAAATKTT